MKIFTSHPMQSAVSYLSIGLMAASSLAFAQDLPAPPAAPNDQQQAAPGAPSSGWRRLGDPAPADQSNPPAYQAYGDGQTDPNQAPPQAPSNGPAPNQQPNYGPPPNYSQQQPNYGPQPNYGQQPNYGPQRPTYQPPPVPPQISVPAGTFLTVRVNQVLSSDKNQPGDAFFATLVEPVVANGVVVAEPGQTISGRVAEAQKAGRVEGVARLGLELTSLTAVDGQQIPIHSQLVSRRGDTSVGRDAGAIVGTTALGAAIGAAADWGRGAAIGAGAGLAASTIGVLLTRGRPSVIYPEQILTFRLEAPITVSTTNSPQAFRYIEPGEYDRPQSYPRTPAPYAGSAPGPYYYGAYGYPYAYPYSYPYYAFGYGYPYYWGPSVGFYFGRGFYGRGYYGRGFRR
jgi:hypothetical protein